MPTISIYLDEDTTERLEQMTREENRSASNMVATLIRQKTFRRANGVLVPSPAPSPTPVSVETATKYEKPAAVPGPASPGPALACGE
jgi:hypothetical protein